jgi:arsenate reductase
MKSIHSFVAAPLGVALTCLASYAAAGEAAPDAGNFVRALWLIQSYGNSQAASPRHDEHTKAVLAKAIGKDGSLTLKGLKELMDASELTKLAGAGSQLSAARIEQALESSVPDSRRRLLPTVAAHASFDRIETGRLDAGEKLADWIVKNYTPGEALDAVFICTGNSRRSVMGATMGNIAAAHYGLPDIRFHSGGTAPTAVNERTIVALRAIGVEIEDTGEKAAPGPAGGANPVYSIRWGQPGTTDEPAVEATEFSKRFDDETSPQTGFAALMVCSEADAECPFVKGAALRVSMPYLDPKIFDGGSFESVKYAERRDDLGRLMLAVMLEVRRRIDEKNADGKNQTEAPKKS